MDDGWLGKEERDVKKGMFLLSQGEGTDTWKTTSANLKGQKPTESGGHDDNGEDGQGRRGQGLVRGSGESSSHPRSLLSWGHLAIQGS